MSNRTILSSGRIVRTIEGIDVFYVVRGFSAGSWSVSGPFPRNDSRFSACLN